MTIPAANEILTPAYLREIQNLEKIADAALWQPLKISYRGGCHHADAALHLMISVYHGFAEGLHDLESGLRLGLDKMASGRPKSIVIHNDGRVQQVRFKLKTEHVVTGDGHLVFLAQPNVVMDLVAAVTSALKLVLGQVQRTPCRA